MHLTISPTGTTLAQAVMRAQGLLASGHLVGLPVHDQIAIVANAFMPTATTALATLGLHDAPPAPSATPASSAPRTPAPSPSNPVSSAPSPSNPVSSAPSPATPSPYPLAVLIHDLAQLDGLIRPLSSSLISRLEQAWPGPLTVVGEALADLPWRLGPAFGTVQLSCPDNPLVRAILEGSGPLAVVSASPVHTVWIPGEEGDMARGAGTLVASALEAQAVLAALGRPDAVSLWIDDGPVGLGSTTIIDGLKPTPVVLRNGLIPW